MLSLNQLQVESKTYRFYDISSLSHLPYCLKILAENLYRKSGILWDGKTEILFYPSRILMQDFTGVPALVDLAAMREAILQKGGDPLAVNPVIPVDLVIDHSITVDFAGTAEALDKNNHLDYQRNQERYEFLKWASTHFHNVRIVPPGSGICHQVNLEYLASVVVINDEGVIYPDTVLGTDSHTTMINSLSVLGWGVGGIEAEAAMLGQPLFMPIPKVLGVELTGTLSQGCTATDLVLMLTHCLRQKGVVGLFVEFFGAGLNGLSLQDRATIANMAPEYGATCGFFPIDDHTLDYLRATGRDAHHIACVEAYAKAQKLWASVDDDLSYDELMIFDLSTVIPAVAGPKRPQDLVPLTQLKTVVSEVKKGDILQNNDVVIAAITSCTNTSNPNVMIAAGLLAQKAVALGLSVKSFVKTSLAPGSPVVSDYLKQAGLMAPLETLGFYVAGYGCTTCIGNSGVLAADIALDITTHDLSVASVLSGNRNFEGRIHPLVKDNYLASPPLVIAFALAGTTNIDLTRDPIGFSPVLQKEIYLGDLWPTSKEINGCMVRDPLLYTSKNIFNGDALWHGIKDIDESIYPFDEKSTYIQQPPFFHLTPFKACQDARILALLGDSITTDHLSPAGAIKEGSPAYQYLQDQGVVDFNSYGSRRGNHHVMVRGTLANVRLRNELVVDKTGGWTRIIDDGAEEQEATIFDASMWYQSHNIPLVIIAGKEYGTGSSRDWAAKGTRLLGVHAVIAESFERIHRSNLVGMGILPLIFENGVNLHTLRLTGTERISIEIQGGIIVPQGHVTVRVRGVDQETSFKASLGITTQSECDYFNKGGILPYLLERLGVSHIFQKLSKNPLSC